MKKRHLTVPIALTLVLGPLACKREPEKPKEPVKTEEQIRQEQEAERRNKETEALAARAAQAAGAVAELRKKADAREYVPESVAAALDQATAKAGEAERLVAELRQAGADGWEAAKTRLEGALSELEKATASASEALAGWEAKEQEALAAREDEGSPIDPETGLIRGLNGGDYEQYLVSVVEKVQRRLRELGHYAGPADGVFGAATRAAIGRFQEEHNLEVSGVPSPMTRGKLFA